MKAVARNCSTMRPLGVGVDAHAALFLDDVALLIELAGDGMADATALQVGPEFEPVGGHAPEVLGGVFAGGSVEADGAVLLGQFGELVGDDVFLGCRLGVLEDLLQCGQLRRVAGRRVLRYSAS